jgi:hypothetical protein
MVEIPDDDMCEDLERTDRRVKEGHGCIENAMDRFMMQILRDEVREHIRGNTPMKSVIESQMPKTYALTSRT